MRDVVLVGVATVDADGSGRAARSLIAAAVIRRLLAETTGAADVALDRADDGRVVVRSLAGWHASVSHAHQVVVCAVARRPVGVDVEARPGPPFEATFVRRTCTPAEATALDRLAAGPREEALLRAWVRKEAVAKGLGRGLHEPFDRLDVRHGSVVVADGGRWGVRDEALPAPSDTGHVVAVAAPGRWWRVDVREVSEPLRPDR